MTDTSWSWTFVGANRITMGPIPDAPEMDEDLEEWIDQIGSGLVLATSIPGKRISIDVSTLLNAWVAGGFAEKLPYTYRMTLKGQEVDAPPRVPIAVYGAGMTAPWTTEEGVDSPCPIN